MKSRVLAIGINSQYIHTNLAIRYFKANSGCEIFECSINDNIFDVYSKLLSKDFEIFAFSVYIWNKGFAINLINMLKAAKPNLKIIAGGPEAGFAPDDFFDLCPSCDAIAFGEGENTFISLEQGTELSKTPNLIFRDFKTEFVPVDLNFVKFPYTKKDTENSKILYFETSRGCLFNCSYCLSSAMEKTRYFPMEYVKKGIDFFVDNNVPLVKLVDRTFNDNDQRCCEILEYIIEKSEKTHFHFEISPMLITDRFCDLCRKAKNLIQVEIGVQTVNAPTMKAINRSFNLDKIKENVLKLPSNIHKHIDVIAGLPLDTKETVKDAFNYVYSLKPDMLQLGFLKVLKGTKMESDAKKYSISTTAFPPYEVLSTSTISPKEMNEIKITEKAVDRILNSASFARVVKKAETEDMYSFFENIGLKLFEMENQGPLSKAGLYVALLEILGNDYKCELAFDFLENNKKATLPQEFCDEIPNIKELHKKVKSIEEFKNSKVRLVAFCNKIYILYEDSLFDLKNYI